MWSWKTSEPGFSGPSARQLHISDNFTLATLLSSTFCDESGQPFHQLKLHSEYAVTELLEVTIPEGMREFQLRLMPDPRSLGNRAWVLGAGMR